MADLPCVELIEFIRPDKNEVNLYITNISGRMDKETAQVKLLDVFSQFGLVYEVQVIDSSLNVEATDEPTTNKRVSHNCTSFYAFVKYYSARAAARAKERINGKRLLDGHFLKVQFAQRKKCADIQPLYMAKCTELANYYFGFNGWSTRIIQIDKFENVKISDSQEMYSAMFRSVVRLEIKGCDFFCDGTGYGGDRTTIQEEKDPIKRLQLLGYAKKLAHRHGFENAFKRVLIVSLDNGKVGVEINQKDIPECSLNESGEEGVVHVNQVEEQTFSDSDEEENRLLECESNSLVNFADSVS